MIDTVQSESTPAAANADRLRALGEIDKSLRFSCLFFIACALLWLITASVLALVTGFQSHRPDFLAQFEWTTLGRLYPVACNALLFGWGCNVIFAIALWMIARLSLTPVKDGGMLILAGVFWNFGLKLGLAGILIGDFVPVEFLELPGYATPIMLLAYALIGVRAIQAFLNRSERSGSPVQWYIITALFCFPWMYMIAQFMVVWFPVRGVVQSIVSSWFTGSLLNLWFVPMALAIAYYLIPRILNRPIYSTSLALFGFCSLVLTGGWTGLAQLVDGPVPVWLTATSIVASIVMIFPITTTASNLLLSVNGVFAEAWNSLVLRFVLFGLFAWLIFGTAGSLMALNSVNEVLQFTTATSGYIPLLTYAFFSMVVFGALYYIIPRLSGREWPSADLIYLHFWGSAGGIAVIAFVLLIGGWMTGAQMNDPEVAFSDIARSLLPLLKIYSMGIVALIVGHIAFATNFLLMFVVGSSEASARGVMVLESVKQEDAA